MLERLGLPVGVVTSIIGATKSNVTFLGTAGHAGTIPMGMRRDALAAAAEFVLAVEQLGLETPGLVATVGQLSLSPGAANVVPGRVTVSIDVRHADDDVWSGASSALEEAAAEIAARRGVDVIWQHVMDTPGIACDLGLRNALEQSIADAGVPVRRLVSGAGHDAVPISTIAPVAMLFVRCKEGISHNPRESIATEDAAVAIDVFIRTVASIAAR